MILFGVWLICIRMNMGTNPGTVNWVQNAIEIKKYKTKKIHFPKIQNQFKVGIKTENQLIYDKLL